jgi:hypothetical protein
MPALGILARAQGNCSESIINEAVAWEFLLMDLALKAKGKRKCFEVQNLARHNGFWSVDLRYTPLHREVIEQLDRI